MAICSSTVISLNIDLSSCTYISTGFVVSQSSKIKVLSLYTAPSDISVKIQTISPYSFFNNVSVLLNSAISSGSFTQNLINACKSLNVSNSVSTATVIGLTATGLKVIGQNSTGQSTISNVSNLSYFSITEILSIFFECISSMLILFLIYYFYKYSNLPIIVKKPYLELDLSDIELDPLDIEQVVLEQVVLEQVVLEQVVLEQPSNI